MQHVFVLDTNKKPMNPCTPEKARKLLSNNKAAVLRLYPFTIILHRAADNCSQLGQYRLKIDPGSQHTGFAIINEDTGKVVWAAELKHRGWSIKDDLKKRAGVRRGRRQRHTWYRPARFNNRYKPKGWLAPSVRHRIYTVMTWVHRILKLIPITAISYELVKFDTQLMENAEISGVEYQQGALKGYEVREYLLEKWEHRCAYCVARDPELLKKPLSKDPLEVEHIVPRARGGSDRISNLVMACHKCNQKKGTKTAAEFGFPEIQSQAKKTLKDAAVMNAIRWQTYESLKALGFPVEAGTGGMTKYNRCRLGFPKSHWIDAACVGASTPDNLDIRGIQPLMISAVGHGSRQMCAVDKYGFPRTGPKGSKFVHGFQSGDIVKAIVPSGKWKGTHIGRIAIRSSGNFTVGGIARANYKYCTLLQRNDGYGYEYGDLDMDTSDMKEQNSEQT